MRETPREQRPGRLKTASELEREAALQLYQSGKGARNRLREFSHTFEACLLTAQTTVHTFLAGRAGAAPDLATELVMIEKVAMHYSIQMAQEKQHVISRDRLEELKRLAGVTTKPRKESAPMTAPVTAPIVDHTPSPLPPSEREPMELDGFDEPDQHQEDDDLPF